MNPLKKNLMEIAKEITDETTLDQVIEELVFKSKVVEGLRQLDNGEGIPHDDVKRRVAKWFSKRSR